MLFSLLEIVRSPNHPTGGRLGPGGKAQKRRKLPGPLLQSKKKITKNIHFRRQQLIKLVDELYFRGKRNPILQRP